MEHLILLLSTPSTAYPHTCTSRSWLYDLLTLWVRSLTLQNIWNKYALVFLPTLSSTKAFRSRRKKAHKKALVRIQTILSEWECHSRNLFLFLKTFWKPPDVILSKEWVSGVLWIILSLNRPRKEKAKSPMDIKVKRVSKVWPTYSVWDRMCSCNLCMMKRWSIAATPNQQPKV